MYRCPPAGFHDSCEWEINRSRFISMMGRINSEEEARDFIDRVKAEYPDAWHHCHAFIVHCENAQPRCHSSDDGEPAGTAGRPMLDVLKGSGMENIISVVVRYFGGIKLGTGGLVKAYSHSVSLGLDLIKPVERNLLNVWTLSVDHADAGKIEAELRAQGRAFIEVEYGVRATIQLAAPPEEEAAIKGHIAALTQGQGELKAAGQRWIERSVE